LAHDGNGSIRLDPSGSDACVWEFQRLRSDQYRIVTNDSRALAQQGPGLPPVLVPVQTLEQTTKILHGEAGKDIQTAKDTSQTKDMTEQDTTNENNQVTKKQSGDQTAKESQKGKAKAQANNMSTQDGANASAQKTKTNKLTKDETEQANQKNNGAMRTTSDTAAQDNTRASQKVDAAKQKSATKTQDATKVNSQKAEARAQAGDQTVKDTESANGTNQSRNEVMGQEATTASQKEGDAAQKNTMKNQTAQARAQVSDETAKDAGSASQDVESTSDMKQTKNVAAGQNATGSPQKKAQDAAKAKNQQAKTGPQAGYETAQDAESSKDIKQTNNEATGQNATGASQKTADAKQTNNMKAQDVAKVNNQQAKAGYDTSQDAESAKDIKQSRDEVTGGKQSNTSVHDAATATKQKSTSNVRSDETTVGNQSTKRVMQTRSNMTSQDATSAKQQAGNVDQNSDLATQDATKAPNQMAGRNTTKNITIEKPMTTQEEKEQVWDVIFTGPAQFRLKHENSGMVLGVIKDQNESLHIVTKPASDAQPQNWLTEKVADSKQRCIARLASCPTIHECGFVDDLCGGTLACGSATDGSCMQRNNVTGQPFICTDEHTCRCQSKVACTSSNSCGHEPDGCGGVVTCGRYGLCRQKNNVTGEQYACSVSKTAVQTLNVALANGSTLTGLTARSGHCNCLPKLCNRSFGAACGILEDGCGGQVNCSCALQETTTSTTTTVTTIATTPPTTTTTTCKPRDKCDEGMQCGFQSDGCGGKLACGSSAGSCITGRNTTCTTDHRCVCTPLTCEGRCGIVDDGCGDEIACKCSMSNEMCDRELQICIAVPQPPPQGLGSLANTTWNNTNSTFGNASFPYVGNASFPYVDAVSANGSALPGIDKDGKPVLDPVSNKKLLTPELFKLYTFYYYFFYYYHLIELKAAHVSPEDAAKEAAVLAKPSAAEQLRITFFNETEGMAEEKVKTGKLDDPMIVKFLAASARMHDPRNSSNSADKQVAAQAAALARRAVSKPLLRR